MVQQIVKFFFGKSFVYRWMICAMPFLYGCHAEQSQQISSPVSDSDTLSTTPPGPLPVPPEPEPATIIPADYVQWVALQPDSALVRPHWLDTTLILDIRYATVENFTGQALYPCAECLLRKKMALQLLKAAELLGQEGYRLLLLDCYRPLSVQWALWNTKPDRRYVADPRKGSMHNRAAAVDLTLASPTGQELDMGTPYDSFSRIAWPDYNQLPQEVLERRAALAKAMKAVGFLPTSSEWWHFSYHGQRYSILDTLWECETEMQASGRH